MTRHLRITSIICLSLLLVSLTHVDAKRRRAQKDEPSKGSKTYKPSSGNKPEKNQTLASNTTSPLEGSL